MFLEARDQGEHDLQRNAMVSGKISRRITVTVIFALTWKVLLRVLEYYEGILILTTNRLRTLDIAVQSRIRKYPLQYRMTS